MEVKILSVKNVEIGKINLSEQFYEDIRPDIIKRAVHAIQSHKRQPYGAKPTAGKRASAKLSRRRRKYKTSYGIGISRVPRKIMSRHCTRFNWVGAFAPGMVGGRRANPPKAEKILTQKINKKERKKAIRSGISSTIIKEMVVKRGHIIPVTYPFVIEAGFESINKAKEIVNVLRDIGLNEELERVSKKTIRSGKGKTRGRKYKRKIGPLIVVSNDCNIIKAGRNIPGVDIVKVKNLNVELLAPGTEAGRLTIWTEPSIRILEKERLFI